MKKIGIVLFALSFWVIATAQDIHVGDTADNAPVEKSIDSLQKMDVGDHIDSKEAYLLQKLSPEQLMELEKERLINIRNSDMPFSKLGLLLISIAPFLMVILIVYLSNNQRDKESVRKYELYMKAIEKGQPVPDSYFKEQERTKMSNLQKGALWLAVGLALLLVALVMKKSFFMFGIVPAFVGAAYLLVNFFENPKKDISEKEHE